MLIEKAKDVKTADELVGFVTDTVAEIEAPVGSDPDAARIREEIRLLFDPKVVVRELRNARRVGGVNSVQLFVTECVERALARNDVKSSAAPLIDNRAPGFTPLMDEGTLYDDETLE